MPTPRGLALFALSSLSVACSGGGTEPPPAPPTPPAIEPSQASSRWTSLDPPAAEGALGASLTATSDGVVGTWLEPVAEGAHRVRAAILREDAWGAPVTVAEGADVVANWADFPRAARGGDGSLYLHHLRRAGEAAYAYEIQLARSRDGGRTFESLGVVHRDGTPTEHGFVAMVPDADGLRLVWLDGRATVEEGGATAVYTARVGAEVGPSTPVDERACDCCQTDAAVTADGPLVVYRDRAADETRDVSVSRGIGDGFTPPAVVHADGWEIAGCPVNGPAVDAEGREVVVAWFTGAQGGAVRVAFSRDGGRRFEAPISVDDGQPPGRVDVRLVNGGAAVSWLARGARFAEVRVRFVGRDGRLGRSTVVGATDAARASGFPVMVREGERLLVAHRDASSPPRIRVSALPTAGLPRAPGDEPPPPSSPLAVGAARPAARVRGADDTPRSLDALAAGAPLLLAFHARWCQPCREELRLLEGLRGRLPEGVRLVAVSLDEGPAARAESVARSWGFQGAVVRDDGAAAALGVPPIPALFLFASDGRLLARWVGEPATADAILRAVRAAR